MVVWDYKVTTSPMLEVDKYPLPKSNDLFATLTGRKHFTKIDFTNAYQQMSLDENSQQLATIPIRGPTGIPDSLLE